MNRPHLNPFPSFKQRSAVTSRSPPVPCCPQRPAVTGLWRTRGRCGAAWGPTWGWPLVAPVRGPAAWGQEGWAIRTRSVAAARGRRAMCCCWGVRLCSRRSPSDRTCCSWENYRWEESERENCKTSQNCKTILSSVWGSKLFLCLLCWCVGPMYSWKYWNLLLIYNI